MLRSVALKRSWTPSKPSFGFGLVFTKSFRFGFKTDPALSTGMLISNLLPQNPTPAPDISQIKCWTHSVLCVAE